MIARKSAAHMGKNGKSALGSQNALQIAAEFAAPIPGFAAIHDHFVLVCVIDAQFLDKVDVDQGRAVDTDQTAVLQFFFDGRQRLAQDERFPAALDFYAIDFLGSEENEYFAFFNRYSFTHHTPASFVSCQDYGVEIRIWQ
jgi:hypothetical protein